jgi:hypothetical protein
VDGDGEELRRAVLRVEAAWWGHVASSLLLIVEINRICSPPLNSYVVCTEFLHLILFPPFLRYPPGPWCPTLGSHSGPFKDETMPQYFKGIFLKCMGTIPMIFMSHLLVAWILQYIVTARDDGECYFVSRC